MLSGQKTNYYAIRAAPGAGRNFLAVLLNRHYNNNSFLIHYSKTFNEYFNTSELVPDVNGKYTIPFWDNKFKFINLRERIDSDYIDRIVHEHEWMETDRDIRIRRFEAFAIDSNSGINPKTFIENIIQGYYITLETQEEINFVTKLIYIKKYFGDRPELMYDKDISSISHPDEYDVIVKLSPIGTAQTQFNPYMLKLETVSTSEMLTLWEKYITFLKENVPLYYPLSDFNLYYFSQYFIEKYSLFNIDCYLTYYERFKRSKLKKHYVPNHMLREETKIKKIKSKDVNFKVIAYKDMFLDLLNTDTPFDNFKPEIKEYTKRNLQLIEMFENFYGEILN